MKVDKKQDKQKIEVTVAVSRADVDDILKRVAGEISKVKQIPGFRPGKAPYAMIVSKFGEETIIREALDDIVADTLDKVIVEHGIKPYGKIDFDLKSVGTGEPLVEYVAHITPLPQVELGNWTEKKIKRNPVLVPKEDLENALKEISGMAKTETVVEREAKMGDKTVLDFEVKVDGKVIEGGTAQDFSLVLGEGKMIPGFEEKIVGRKAGESFEFEQNFPKDYHAEHLSGKPALFKINLKQVAELTLPEVNDEFAKKVGMENLQQLKDRLEENLGKEKFGKEEDRVEIEAIKQLVATSKIEELPDRIVSDSVQDLFHEFEHNLVHQGLNLEQYLKSSKKTSEEVKKELEPKAIERVKSTLVLSKLANEQGIGIEESEIDQEVKAQKNYYANNPQAQHDLQQPEYREHLRRTLLNRKIIQFIKSKIVES